MLQENRGTWFKYIKNVLKLFIRRPKFKYLGEPVTEPSIIISNHVGASAPLAWELYFPNQFHFWGTHEMAEGVRSVLNYLSNIYFYKKKHWNYVFSHAFSVIAAPFVTAFYKGLRLIPTYNDHRFRHTIASSIEALKEHKNSIIIFPEDSSEGYYDQMTGFYGGFILLAERSLKKGFDLPIFLSYFKKDENAFIIDKPIRYSELKKKLADRDEMVSAMLQRTNELALLPAHTE